MARALPRNRIAALALAGALLAGCGGYKRLSTGSLDEVQRLAIVTRVEGKLIVDGAGQAGPAASAKDADKALAEELGQQVTRFEIEERLRTSLVGELPAAPPWSTAMPAVEVSTVLDSLLVDDRSGPPDYRPLAARGCNSVLEIVLDRIELKSAQAKTGLRIEGEARLFMLDGSTLWRFPIGLDELADPESESLDLASLKQGGYREALVRAIGRITSKLAADLSGGQQ